MAGTLREIKFIRPWQNYRKGDRITPNGTLRDWLIRTGYAEIADEASQPVRSPVNRMARPSTVRKRA